MIFVSLGSQKFQFNRLLYFIDSLIEEGVIKEDVFAQIGNSDYKPNLFKYDDFLSRNDYIDKIKQSSYVITHSGTGAIVTALKKEKKIIVIPRLSEFGEHVDNHQIEIANIFYQTNLVLVAQDYDSLKKSIMKKDTWTPAIFSGNNDSYLNFLTEYIENEG